MSCSFCEFTYDPCPVHDPDGYARHQRDTDIDLARRFVLRRSWCFCQFFAPRWVGVLILKHQERVSP